MSTPTRLRREFGARLRALREAARKTLEEAGAYIGTSHSSLSRVESGKRALTPVETSELLDFYGVKGDDRLRTVLVNMARQARQNEKVWFEAYRDVLSGKYFTWLSMEREAIRINGISPLVPVYFQTEAYARSLIGAGNYSAEQIDRLVTARIQRRDVLERPNAPEIWTILDEGKIIRQIGGSATLAEQLDALVEWSEHPRVTFQIIPLVKGEYPNMGDYTIFDFDEEVSPVVAVDTLTGPLYLERESEIRTYQSAFEHHVASGLAPDDSVTLLKKLSTNLRKEL